MVNAVEYFFDNVVVFLLSFYYFVTGTMKILCSVG